MYIDSINFNKKSDSAVEGDLVWFVGDKGEKDFLVGEVEAVNLFSANQEFLYAIRAPMGEGLFIHKLLTVDQFGFTINLKRRKELDYAISR